jgi:hypothetical protein
VLNQLSIIEKKQAKLKHLNEKFILKILFSKCTLLGRARAKHAQTKKKRICLVEPT